MKSHGVIASLNAAETEENRKTRKPQSTCIPVRLHIYKPWHSSQMQRGDFWNGFMDATCSWGGSDKHSGLFGWIKPPGLLTPRTILLSVLQSSTTSAGSLKHSSGCVLFLSGSYPSHISPSQSLYLSSFVCQNISSTFTAFQQASYALEHWNVRESSFKFFIHQHQ